MLKNEISDAVTIFSMPYFKTSVAFKKVAEPMAMDKPAKI